MPDRVYSLKMGLLTLFILLFSAGVFAEPVSPYEPVDTNSDTGNQRQAPQVTLCEQIDSGDAPMILLLNSTPVYFEANSSAVTQITIPAGSTYRLLNTVTVDDENGNPVAWYEIDGPCPSGAGSTLWFPEGTAFTVVPQD